MYELEIRRKEIEDLFGISLEILTFEQWVKEQFDRALAENIVTEQMLSSAWITAYTESLTQRRRDITPIDEQCYQWLFTLKILLARE